MPELWAAVVSAISKVLSTSRKVPRTIGSRRAWDFRVFLNDTDRTP
jgi:hypothetical protein